jgi:hypothetical protein
MLWFLLPLALRYQIGEVLATLGRVVDAALISIQRRLCDILRSAVARGKRQHGAARGTTM